MTDYKRLTERDEFGNADIIGIDSELLYENLIGEENNKLTNALNRFAELEDMIEQGLLIKLPCKVGDTVYRVLHCPDFVYGWKLDEFIIKSDGIIAFDTSNTIIKPSDWGETVFLTKAEAEARLEQLKRGEK